jgi:hypothetical protein
VSLHRRVQKDQVTVVSLEGSHILSFAVVTGFHQLTVQLIDQSASLESIDRFLGLPMGLSYKGPNSEARAVAQLRPNHWLSGVNLKRIKKRSHDGCWFCEPSHNSQDTPRMTRTHVLLRCVAFEEFRRETWTDPLTGEFTRPSSIGQLLGNPRWEKRLLKFLQRTKIGRIGPDLIDDEVRRVTRYEGWTDLVPDERSIDRGEQVADHILDTIVVRQT